MKNSMLFLSICGLLSCGNSNSEHSENVPVQVSASIMTQNEIKALMLPLLKSDGGLYEKYLNVLAREAKGGEEIHTVTSDGLETTNTAKKGDFIVMNQTKAGEAYIMSAEKFHKRYQLAEMREGDLHLYKPTGKIYVLEMNAALRHKLNLPEEFQIGTAWDSEMVVKENDFLACPPDFSEVYRIARQEFFETYRPVSK